MTVPKVAKNKGSSGHSFAPCELTGIQIGATDIVTILLSIWLLVVGLNHF